MFAHDEFYDACRGKNPPPPLSSPQDQEGGIQTFEKLREKRRVGNTYSHLVTRLNSGVTSETSPLVIEGVKYGYGQANQACRSVKLEEENGGK